MLPVKYFNVFLCIIFALHMPHSFPEGNSAAASLIRGAKTGLYISSSALATSPAQLATIAIPPPFLTSSKKRICAGLSLSFPTLTSTARKRPVDFCKPNISATPFSPANLRNICFLGSYTPVVLFRQALNPDTAKNANISFVAVFAFFLGLLVLAVILRRNSSLVMLPKLKVPNND